MRVFIDGAAGTVGGHLLDTLNRLNLGLDLVVLPDSDRKIDSHRKEAMATADAVVLCLPDDAAAAAVAMVNEANPRAYVLDASATHRTHPDWVYGMPEVSKTAIAGAKRVANPGCLATGCILIARGLKNLIRPDTMYFSGVTGYSAGGNKASETARIAQFGKTHRHIPEVLKYGILRNAHINTVVGPWFRGMAVQTAFSCPESPENIVAAMNANLVNPLAFGSTLDISLVTDPSRINIEQHVGTNNASLLVSKIGDIVHIAAVYDNLGKGAAGIAANNLRSMLFS